MKKSILTLAAAMLLSPAVFAQQDAGSAAPSQTPQSQQQAQSSKAKLTPEEKAELKQLRGKAKTECKADKKSDACKQARAELRAKKNEYGIKNTGHKGHRHQKGSQAPA